MSPDTASLLESDYLIISNRDKCKSVLVKFKENRSGWSENDMVDFFISLHLVLEVGLNAFFRHISLYEIKKDIDKLKIAENVDCVSFIDKTILFIYNAHFDFKDSLVLATKYHSIIKEIRDFNAVRNKLLHGHSIGSIFSEDGVSNSKARTLITPDNMTKQISKFKSIMIGVKYYFDCLKSPISPNEKEEFKLAYLDYSFLDV